MKKTVIALAVASAIASPAFANGFVNGDFETGTAAGWTTAGSYYRGGVNNTALTPALVLGSGSVDTHSAVISTAYVDPNVGAALGSTVYGGNYAYRVEDTTYGGYASVLSQTVTNYTDSNIFFAWKAVLLGAHGVSDAATLKITLTDNTTNTVLISRDYNAASGGSGVDPRFSLLNNNYYTPTWQIEQLSIGAGLSGHDFTLSVLASDCQPTGHWGYAYVDGFSNVIPTTNVPEPESLALVGLGLAGLAASRRRKVAA
jgi:hypothetical protein